MPRTSSGALDDPVYTRLRARFANLSRYRDPDDPERVEASIDVSAMRLELAIRQALAARPALTPDRRTRLAVLLLDGVAAVYGRPAGELFTDDGPVAGAR